MSAQNCFYTYRYMSALRLRLSLYKTSPDNSHEVINLSIRFEDTVNPEENYTIVNEIIQ